MNILLNETGLSEADVERIRREAKDYAGTFPNVTAAAKDAGIAYSTFAAWLDDKYSGDNAKIAAKAKNWLDARQNLAEVVAAAPTIPGFVLTPTAQKILALCTYAQAISDLAVAIGGAGIGKTWALKHYAAKTPNVWMATMDPETAGLNRMMREICEAMGLMERNASEYTRAVSRKVRSLAPARCLLIVDEAQHLTSESLDHLRSIQDKCGLGLMLAGNQTVYARLEGGRKEHFSQLFSRVGCKLPPQSLPAVTDIDMLLESWLIGEAGEAKYLRAIARKPGGLRVMTKTLTLATMMAAGVGEPRVMKHLTAAYGQLSGGADTSGA